MVRGMISLTLLLASLNAVATDGSPIASTVTGLSIPNAHIVATNSRGLPSAIRGMAPQNQAQFLELRQLGVTNVLIFKNQVNDEVTKEVQHLQRLGLPANRIHQIPFPWKDLNDFPAACEMTVQALQILAQTEKAGGRTFFHCTVGEDRTGYLAGLHLLASGRAKEVRQVFNDEMCEKGYEAGNPFKPVDRVVLKIRETLTPTFLKMASLLKTYGLRPDLCRQPLRSQPQADANIYICKASKKVLKK